MSTTAIPQWIAKMYRSKVGQDHLGLGSVSSDQILPTLSPGINVLTIHPRYYSFYIFLLDEFWRRDRPRSRNAWVRFYRPREFIFSLGANLCDQPEHGEMHTVVGTHRTGPLAAQKLDSYDTTFDYINTDLGGYGLYYRSVIAQLGLLYPGGPGLPYPIDVPTEQGKEVADVFRQAVQNTAYYRDYFDDDETQVAIDIIRDYIRQACLCQVRRTSSHDHYLLLDVFLHGGPESEARSNTFRLFLDIALQTQGHSVDQDTFRQLLYFGATHNGANYIPHKLVEKSYHSWRLYQAREYYAFALNALWYHLCDWGINQGGVLYPIPLSNLWEHIDYALNFDNLAIILGVQEPQLKSSSSFVSLLDWLKGLVESAADTFDIACTIDAPINEHRLYRLAIDYRNTPEVMVAGMITMLALIFLRFGLPDCWLRSEWVISCMGADGRRSVDGFLKQMHKQLESTPITISNIARWIFTEYIILQHQLVATTKLPENTFRFQQEGDRLRFYNISNSLVFTDSRFDALSTTLYDLGLCGDFRQLIHPLTPEGEHLLVEGNLK